MPEDDVTRIHDIRGGDAPRAGTNRVRPDDGNAFLPDPHSDQGAGTAASSDDDDASADLGGELAAEFLTAATGNIDMGEQQLDQVSDNEIGGPFVISDEEHEMADDVDGTNPIDATREPFPTAMRGDQSPPVSRS